MRVVVNVEGSEVIREESFIKYAKEKIFNDPYSSLSRIFSDFLDENYETLTLFCLSQNKKEEIIEHFVDTLIDGYNEEYFFVTELI